jgi:hypothetical protein
MIDSEQAANAAFRKAAVAFLQHGQEAINPALGEADECDARSIDIAGSSADRAERHE